jgi:hypothetical protein
MGYFKLTYLAKDFQVIQIYCPNYLVEETINDCNTDCNLLQFVIQHAFINISPFDEEVVCSHCQTCFTKLKILN